jgi:hypothetical protein
MTGSPCRSSRPTVILVNPSPSGNVTGCAVRCQRSVCIVSLLSTGDNPGFHMNLSAYRKEHRCDCARILIIEAKTAAEICCDAQLLSTNNDFSSLAWSDFSPRANRDAANRHCCGGRLA